VAGASRSRFPFPVSRSPLSFPNASARHGSRRLPPRRKPHGSRRLPPRRKLLGIVKFLAPTLQKKTVRDRRAIANRCTLTLRP
jgi:hypothetical protein